MSNLSEEEKKAIKKLTEIKELVEEDLKFKDYGVTAILDQIDLNSLVLVLNLIDKQQKEIEDLYEVLEEWINGERYNCIFYISKDKIREKITELENLYKNKYDLYMGYKFESREQQDIEKQIEVLKELLGEENE